MANKDDQKKFRERMKSAGKVYFQRWIPKELMADIIKLIETYKG